MEKYAYIGSGLVLMRKAGEKSPMRAVGNCSELSVSFSTNDKTLTDFTQAGGGVYASVSRIESIEVKMKLHDMSPENLAMVLFGDATKITGSEVSGEKQIAKPNSFVATDKMAKSISSLKSGGKELIENKDFFFSRGVIEFENSDNIKPEGTEIEIDYKSEDTSIIEAITTSGGTYELFFAGMNEVRDGKKVNVRIFAVKVGAAQDLSFIGEDFAAIDVTGTALRKTGAVGAGKSAYFNVVIQD